MIAVRPLRVSDRASAVALGVAVFAGFGDYRAALQGWTENNAMQTLVAVSPDGGILGLSVVALLNTGFDTEAQLLALGVAEAQRGRGLGRRLLAAAIEVARRDAMPWGATQLKLQVAEDNRAARALFQSAGFQAVPGKELGYADGRRAMSFARSLAD